MTIREGVETLLACGHPVGCSCSDFLLDMSPATQTGREIMRAIVYLTYQIELDWTEAIVENARRVDATACPGWIRTAFETPAPSEASV